MKPNAALAIALVVLALIFAGFAVFYFTTKTSFLASDTSVHYKHAILFTVLTLLALIAAKFARRGTVARRAR